MCKEWRLGVIVLVMQVFAVLLAVECSGAVFHVDPVTGNDAADGLTPETAWKTWNVFPTKGGLGSSLLLKRGCKFTLPLPIVGGTAGAPVVYGAYGNGPKPVLENKTIDLSEPASWTEESKGIWRSPSMPEVANVLLGGARCGNMRYTKAELQNQGQWFQDATGRGPLFIRSTQNPAIEWKSIEVIPAGNGIVLWGAPHSHIRFENLWLRKIGTHGIWMPNGVADVTIRNCDLNLIGGAIFRQDGFSRSYGERFVERRVRFGNAIETWGNVADVLIEGCRITDVFDGGITLQGLNATARNIVVRNNVIWYCGYDSIDIAHGLAPINVIIEHNTCWNAGEGWALQGEARPRYSLHIPDQIGYHLNFEIFGKPWDEQTAVTVRNNIFADAPAGRCFNFAPQPPLAADFQRFKIDRNCYFQANPADTLVQFGSRGFAPKRFGAAQFDEYRKFSGWDAGSIVADPLFVDAASADFRLQPGSPCTGMGAQGAVLQAESAAGRQ